MSEEQSTVITLFGAWEGPVADPARRFRGHVRHSSRPEVTPELPATVTFEHSGKRVSGAAEHGTYVLTVGERRLPLMSFTCRSAATTGPEGHDDMREAEWQAVPLTGRE